MEEQAETEEGYVNCSRINLMIIISGMTIRFVEIEAHTTRKIIY